MHARISAERDPETGIVRYQISDLNSTNGTLLNGHPSPKLSKRGDKGNNWRSSLPL